MPRVLAPFTGFWPTVGRIAGAVYSLEQVVRHGVHALGLHGLLRVGERVQHSLAAQRSPGQVLRGPLPVATANRAGGQTQRNEMQPGNKDLSVWGLPHR